MKHRSIQSDIKYAEQCFAYFLRIWTPFHHEQVELFCKNVSLTNWILCGTIFRVLEPLARMFGTPCNILVTNVNTGNLARECTFVKILSFFSLLRCGEIFEIERLMSSVRRRHTGLRACTQMVMCHIFRSNHYLSRWSCLLPASIMTLSAFLISAGGVSKNPRLPVHL